MKKVNLLMIIGIGNDIVDVTRIRKIFEGHPEKAEKIFTEREMIYCENFSNPAPHYAARFSAKEAYYKCFGTGSLIFREIEIQNHASGKPFIVLHGKTEKLWKEHQKPIIHVTLSHLEDYAMATVVIEKV